GLEVGRRTVELSEDDVQPLFLEQPIDLSQEQVLDASRGQVTDTKRRRAGRGGFRATGGEDGRDRAARHDAKACRAASAEELAASDVRGKDADDAAALAGCAAAAAQDFGPSTASASGR